MTVLEAIQKGTEFLTRKGVDSPRLQVELLLGHVLQIPRMRLYLGFDHQLAADQVDLLRELLKRRGQREPLQYIVGSTSFCGIEIAVGRDVLIPRPETEMLAEMGWKHLQAIVDKGVAKPRALDYGTGSGCLAIAMAFHCPTAEVIAVDASEGALDVARRNVENRQLSERVKRARVSDLTGCAEFAPFDLVISNPPYIPSAEIEQLAPEVRDFEPRMALDGGADGLDWYRRFARNGAALLSRAGCLMLEFGDGQAPAITDLMHQENWIVERVVQDYNQRPRILVARR